MKSSGSAVAVVAMVLLLGACGAPAPDPEGPVDSAPTTSAVAIALTPVTDALKAPKSVADPGDGRLFLSDQHGSIHVLDGDAVLPEPLLDLTDRVLPPSTNYLELGLAGFALSPGFAENGRLYTFATVEPRPNSAPGTRRVDVLTEWTVSASNPNVVDPASERELLAVDRQILEHVGGDIVFDDDRMLYVGFGVRLDDEEAQDPTTLPGSIIRIDVESGDPYGIPADNPFVGGGGAPEVFSFGYRNPHRLSWDEEWGLLVSDPMWTAKDQPVHRPEAGSNSGYPLVHRVTSGSCFEDGVALDGCLSTPADAPLLPPVLEYGKDVGAIVSGALIYRGSELPELAGLAIVADWEGALLAATPSDDAPWAFELLEFEYPEQPFSNLLWALESDGNGELYLMTVAGDFESGEVFRVTAG
jgi:glucose/arabinose dehydrogenase